MASKKTITSVASGLCALLLAGWLAGAEPAASGGLAAPSDDASLFEAVEPHMGTLVRIKLYATDVEQARRAFRKAFDRIGQLDAILSDYTAESEISRLGAAVAGQPIPISDDLFRVLSVSQELAAQTGGAFDVTLGPVTRLWRQARKDGRPPDPAALREASSRCGYQKLHVDASAVNGRGHTVTLDQANMQLDVGGIAKGYAADAALESLRESGIESALVAVSGDIAASGPPPGKRGWRVGIRPLPDSSSEMRVLVLSKAAVSSSGDAEQHLDFAGERYSHIVDPGSGTGITRRIGVSVVAPSGILADGLATAVNVRGPERGIEIVERQPGAAVLIAVREEESREGGEGAIRRLVGQEIRVLESSRFGSFVDARTALR